MKKLFSALLLFAICGSLKAQTFTTSLFKGGFSTPINLQNAGDERLFVVEQAGRIKILNPDATVNGTPFLDITGIISSGGERGLLGLAFHPDYANNGYFYVDYSNTAGNNQISRFSVDPNNPNIADPNSELQLITITQPFSNHNGGCIVFGPDGYLYISSGDGGSGGDPGNRAQNKTLLLGKLLRIDVDTQTGGLNYGIPSDNPFVNDPDTTIKKEIWAFGLRNAWRFSFDFTENNLWIADVGQGDWEELNREPTTAAGLNYGWRCYEGNHTFNTAGCPPQAELTFPLGEYSHAGGNCSVTGGFVYRGTKYSDILGLYFFADLCSGFIGTIANNGDLVNHGSFNGGNWASFGEDVNKELYILNTTGNIYKIEGSVLSTGDSVFENSISMVPNPTSDFVSLKIQNDTFESLQIIDLKGSILYSETAINSSNKNIDTSTLSSGLYFVKMMSKSGNTAIKKLLKQ